MAASGSVVKVEKGIPDGLDVGCEKMGMKDDFTFFGLRNRKSGVATI